MILRIVLGRLPAGMDADLLVELRDRLTRAAQAVNGLESLIVGARRVTRDAEPHVAEAVIVTVWRDADTMTRATVIDDAGFIATRLDLDFTVLRTDYFEIVGRTFAALPSSSTAFLSILTIRSNPNEDARLVETLRDQQPRLVELGLVASHLGRRVVEGGEVEAVNVGVWPDRATVRAVTGGSAEVPLFARELVEWQDRLHLDLYDGIEIAPRLPAAIGPPIFVLDEGLRIVDITAAAAAMLGMPAQDMVGQCVEELSMPDPAGRVTDWRALLARGSAQGETAWAVPSIGVVILRYAARRDVPIPGRHAVLVRRRQDPMPTEEDLDAAIADAFSRS